MKKISLIIIICVSFCMQTQAQKAFCNFNGVNAHDVYVFSARHNHTMLELYGDTIAELLLNKQYISSVSEKCEIDSLVISGKLNDGIFIFPNNDASKTKLFCTATDYQKALRNKEELIIAD